MEFLHADEMVKIVIYLFDHLKKSSKKFQNKKLENFQVFRISLFPYFELFSVFKSECIKADIKKLFFFNFFSIHFIEQQKNNNFFSFLHRLA